MNTNTEFPPQWEKYRSLMDEISQLEHRTIEIMYQALCRKDGDGQPNNDEIILIREMKSILKLKVEEMNNLQKIVLPFLEANRKSENGKLSTH